MKTGRVLDIGSKNNSTTAFKEIVLTVKRLDGHLGHLLPAFYVVLYRSSYYYKQSLLICEIWFSSGFFRNRNRGRALVKVWNNHRRTRHLHLAGNHGCKHTNHSWGPALRFEKRWDVPLCCKALDGKHVVHKAPAISESLLYNHSH